MGVFGFGDKAVDHFDAALRADSTGRAFAAGFDCAEFHCEACLFGHVDVVVKGDDAAVAEHCVDHGEGFVIDGCIELRFRQVGTKWPANRHGADWATTPRAAAKVVKQLAQRDAECLLDESAVTDIAAELDRQTAA